MKHTVCLLIILLHANHVFASPVSFRDSAQYYNKHIDVLMHNLSAISDSSTYYIMLREAFSAALRCDYFEIKGQTSRTKKYKYRLSNRKRLLPYGQKIVEGGLFFYSRTQYHRALEFFKFYLQTLQHPLFDMHNEQLIGKAAYYASLTAYRINDYQTASLYADRALMEDSVAEKAAEVKIGCMQQTMKTQQDSVLYLMVLSELHDKAPDNLNYFKMLVEYFSTPNHRCEMRTFLLNELKKDTTNKSIWALKGETEMQERQWEQAVQSFSHAVKLDTLFVQAIYNIGICYSSKAVEMKDSIAKVRNKPSKEDLTTLRGLFSKAAIYLEKVQRLDPQREIVNWATPLYQVYYVLGDKRKKNVKELMQ